MDYGSLQLLVAYSSYITLVDYNGHYVTAQRLTSAGPRTLH